MMGSSSKAPATRRSEEQEDNSNNNKHTDNNNNTNTTNTNASSNDISKIAWTTVTIKNNDDTNIEKKTKKNDDDVDDEDALSSKTNTTTIQVTNKDVVNVLPKSGLNVVEDFVSEHEAMQLLQEIDTHGTNKFQWEGFERRRKVQRYTVTTTVGMDKNTATNASQPQLPSTLQSIVNRIYDRTNYKTTHVTIEEYPHNQLSKYLQTSKTTVTTFESNTTCPKCYTKEDYEDEYNDNNNTPNPKCCSCCCFVGQLALCVPVIEYINRPQYRSTDCWNLHTKHSWTGLKLNSRCLYFKTDEFLWYWRCRISSVAEALPPTTKKDDDDDDTTTTNNNDGGGSNDDNDNKRRIILIKFSNIPDDNNNNRTNNSSSETTATVDKNTLPLNNGAINNGREGEILSPPKTTDDRCHVDGKGDDPSSSTSLPKLLLEETASNSRDDGSSKDNEMPPLEDILTVIVTTSPIKSNPSTELLELTFSTFPNGGQEFAYQCPKIIVCDGCRTRNDTVTKRHVNDKQSMRNGIVTSTQAQNYEEFKRRLRKLCEEAKSTTATATGDSSTSATSTTPSPFCNTVVEELDTRMGYGYALRHALYNCVKTPYVIVIQHDRTIMRPTPILETVRAMWYDRHHHNKGNNKIKYVGISMRSNLLYRDIFSGKYGKKYVNDMSQAVLRPSELALDGTLYGPNSNSTDNMMYGENDKLKDNIEALIETYRGSQQYADHLEWLASTATNTDTSPATATTTTTDDDDDDDDDASSAGGGGGSKKPNKIAQLSLTPTFFWYDNVHICETAHYRDFIFHPSYKMVAPGGFVEDKVSPVIKKSVERFGLLEGHARFGCYLLDDHSGMFFTGKFLFDEADAGTMNITRK